MTSYDASPYLPERGGLEALREAAAACNGCPLYQDASQTVFGEGAGKARIVLVGEQPGDQEDRQGRPFVGPAGRLLDKALVEAGIDRADTYVTNAVKHFKFTRRDTGKRRIHQTPEAREIVACRPWLSAELQALDPQLIIALGATAGKALLGPGFRVTQVRGQALPCPPLESLGHPVPSDASVSAGDRIIVATVHPSAVLRAPDRDAAYAGLLADLAAASAL